MNKWKVEKEEESYKEEKEEKEKESYKEENEEKEENKKWRIKRKDG